MTTIEPVSERNLDGYGAPPIPWSSVRERPGRRLYAAPDTGGPNRHTGWVATVHPDGRPNVVPVGILGVDGAFYFTAGAGTRRAKNLAENPNCTVSVATHAFDLVVEGTAATVTDEAKVKRIAAVYAAEGWDAHRARRRPLRRVQRASASPTSLTCGFSSRHSRRDTVLTRPVRPLSLPSRSRRPRRAGWAAWSPTTTRDRGHVRALVAIAG